MKKFKSFILENTKEEYDSKILYHVTTVDNEFSIKEQGIIPQEKAMFHGREGQDVRQHKGSIYAMSCYLDALKFAFKLNWDTKMPIIIIAFEDKKSSWKEDTHWESKTSLCGWLYKSGTVSKNQIKEVIYFNMVKDVLKKINTMSTEEQKKYSRWDELNK